MLFRGNPLVTVYHGENIYDYKLKILRPNQNSIPKLFDFI